MTGYLHDLGKLIKADRIEDATQELADLHLQPEADQFAVIEMLALASDVTAMALITHILQERTVHHSVQDRLFQVATDRAHINHEFTRLLLAHGTPDQLRRIVPLFKYVISKVTQGDLLNLVLRTVGKLRLTELTDDVAEFIFYDDAALKRESVKALERMETPTALRHLEHIAATDKCDMDITDAIDMLREKLGISRPESRQAAPAQPSPSLEQPVSTSGAAEKKAVSSRPQKQVQAQDLASKDLQKRFEAYERFSQDPTLVADALHKHLDTDSPSLLINLLRLVTRTIPQKAVGDLMKLAARKKLDKSIKFVLFNAMAAFPNLESAATVLDATCDPAMYLRIAALKVLDRNCSDYIAVELKKQMETGTKAAEALGISILDARAGHLIEALRTSDTFNYIASNYLERNAPVQVIDGYISVLEKRNQISTMKKYSRIRIKASEEKRPFFIVIHPSPSYLDVYTKLIHTCGFASRCFSAPQEAFESIVFEKPAAVICDIFLRQLTVLELASEIRELYSAKEVPIIVSTLQTGFDKSLLNELFKTAGINGLAPFPAPATQIKSWA